MPPVDATSSPLPPRRQYFDEVYRAHMPTVLRYLRRRLGDAAGEDATHDVFVRAYDRFESFDPDRAPIIAWLYGIVANVIAEHHRQEQRRLKAIERAHHADGARTSPAHETTGLSPALVSVLRHLPLGDREALLLTVWGELSYEETAAALSIPIGTVRSRVSRARAALARSLGPQAPPQSSTIEKGSAHA
ncbi:RNA polymerase sigma factor [Patulibacter sp. NPDC049589]|uniref:RNA polymerase sigma factor n=1 Tax=Patulibacter sp. NPDC049589 TaxID=3154731 RepID=UPI00343171A0